jgi:hypothetical protein
MKLPLLEEVGQGDGADYVFQLILLLLCFFDNGFDILSVIHGQDTTQTVSAEVLDKSVKESIAIVEQQALELFRVRERPTIGHCPTGIDLGIFSETLLDSLM